MPLANEGARQHSRPFPAADASAIFAQPQPRGIAPALLISQVRNTVPFIFDSQFASDHPAEAYLHRISDPMASETPPNGPSYFRLCLDAHHATVASFVPTDVDIHIRYKLWNFHLKHSDLIDQAEIVIESRLWKHDKISTRILYHPLDGTPLSGHNGEWFSTAVAAYGACRRRLPELASELLGWIEKEARRENEMLETFYKKNDGLDLLRCCTLVAHNFGDLDRVIDLWNLPEEDPLRATMYKAGHRPKMHLENIHTAGLLNKAMMADENHRHLPLRDARHLRKSPDFLLPIGPFFDDWGRRVAIHPGLSAEEIGQIAECLIKGWERLGMSRGYARALSGMEQAFPGGTTALMRYLPAKSSRNLKCGLLRKMISISEERFKKTQAIAALQFWDQNGRQR